LEDDNSMQNAILNDKRLAEAQAGWAAPNPPSPGGTTWAAPTSPAGVPATPTTAPITDGPVSTWRGAMTVRGTINKTLVLFAILLTAGYFGWQATPDPEVLADGSIQYGFPGIAMVGIIVGLVAVFALIARPQWAKFIAPVYAVGQGFAVGAISAYYNTFFDGIVVQAVGATLGVFLVMLLLYQTRIIKVTERFRRVVVLATLGVMAFYLVSFIVNLIGPEVTFLREPNAIGILFSVGVSVLAALNLTLDFDFIERGTKAGLSKDFEWYAGFGLMVTLVWLYLELLRLLALLQSRN
jgi:uncharacterized YccA/Bax inhibitor family protein